MVNQYTKIMDLTGKRFGRLVVISFGWKNKSGNSKWVCQCDCGNKKVVLSTNLKRGLTKSCGCLHREITSKVHTKHRMINTPEYKIWESIKSRCKDDGKNARIYKNRGIDVCEEWKKDFLSFYNHIGKRPTKKHQIDRIDNNKGYQPGNVRWVLPSENCTNKRTSYIYYIDGKTYESARQAGEDHGVSEGTIYNWVKNKLPGCWRKPKYSNHI